MRAERYIDPMTAVSSRVEVRSLNERGADRGGNPQSPYVVVYRSDATELVLSIVSPTEAWISTRYQSFVINADQLELLATGILEIAARVRLGAEREEH